MSEIHNGDAPRVIHRACGGWLAVAPAHAALKIGVIGSTEEEAVTRFYAVWHHCTEALNISPSQKDDDSAPH